MFKLTELPFSQDALEPYISAMTISYHYGKHHNGYVQKLNKTLAEQHFPSEADTSSLESLIKTVQGNAYNLAAQVWNHDFYWQSLSVPDTQQPSAELIKELSAGFGSVNAFISELKDAAIGEFGSGWAWLVLNNRGAMEVFSTSDADNPMTDGCTPLITLDVWEHAYYLDYQNSRASYIDDFCDHLINWQFLESNLLAAKSSQ